jgi:hypothetical protein
VNPQLILAAPLVYAPCCALTKITLCIFYSRLSPNVTFQWAVWTTVFVCAGAYTGIFFSLIFACKPLAASWNPVLLPTAICVNRVSLPQVLHSPGSLTLYHPFEAPAEANSGVKGAIYIATAVMGIVTDVMLMAIPIPTIWGLQMPMKQKIGLTIIFAVGSMYARLQLRRENIC